MHKNSLKNNQCNDQQKNDKETKTGHHNNTQKTIDLQQNETH